MDCVAYFKTKEKENCSICIFWNLLYLFDYSFIGYLSSYFGHRSIFVEFITVHSLKHLWIPWGGYPSANTIYIFVFAGTYEPHNVLQIPVEVVDLLFHHPCASSSPHLPSSPLKQRILSYDYINVLKLSWLSSIAIDWNAHAFSHYRFIIHTPCFFFITIIIINSISMTSKSAMTTKRCW